MHLTITMLVGLLRAGCQTLYIHQTKNAADIESDKFDCQSIAEPSAYNM